MMRLADKRLQLVVAWLIVCWKGATCVQHNGLGTPTRHYNVLLIVVDDLRPQIKSYGVEYMHTPHIDSLAADGVLFERAYVQQAICSPTRNSFLSGRYPDKTQTWNFIDDFRNGPGANWTALPQFFRTHGYYTTGAGKIYHPNKPANHDQNKSWSEQWPGDFGQCGCGSHSWQGGHATCEDVSPPGPCGDDKIVEIVTGQLERAINGTLAPHVPSHEQPPFFIAAGLHKPHLPFYAPADMFNLYPEPPAPVPRDVPLNMPYNAYHSCLSDKPGIDGYSNWGNFTDIPNTMTLRAPMNNATAAHLRRGYFASVSYTDSNIGKLMAAVSPVLDSTVVVLIGDHGWSLGEQNEWCKMTNFENGVRVPFIFRSPAPTALRGVRSRVIVEAVDLYRTLADLTGVGQQYVESGVDGASRSALIVPDNASTTAAAVANESFARSQFPRCWTAIPENATNLPALDRTDCQDIPKEQFDIMGYSIRTAQWRFTEWRVWDGETLKGRWDIPANGTELYFHGNDTGDVFATETVNRAGDPSLASLVRSLRVQLRAAFP
eukprot:m.677149 g.677149  ORF g.677149 m.677149 type:complete len:547 (-) comp22794_c0_seq3:164-1804(-)